MPQLPTIETSHRPQRCRSSPCCICRAAFRGAGVAFCFFNEACSEFIKVEILLFKGDDEITKAFSDTIEDESKFDFLVEGNPDCRKLRQLVLHRTKVGVHCYVAPTVHGHLEQLLHQQELAIPSLPFVELFKNIPGYLCCSAIEDMMLFDGGE